MTKHEFCKTLLKITMKEVRKVVPEAIIKESWSYQYGDGTVEFHINKCDDLPEGYFWHGRGCCLWDAKAMGWNKYLNKE